MSAGDNAFVKPAPAAALAMFEAEAEGLRELEAANVIRVPEVYNCGIKDGHAYIEMEMLSLERGSAASERLLGEQLAALHRHTNPEFGWHRDNTIGLTPQHNPVGDEWVTFYREQRLAFQLRLAAESGFTGELQEQGARLLKRLPIYFEDGSPSASLLHGDLWGGNWASCGGQPVVFDPAVYYGDRETDLAMTRLFGGFGAAFYDAYESTWPLPDGHYERRLLYQLYHVLNHLNLFGSAYLGQAMQLIDELR